MFNGLSENKNHNYRNRKLNHSEYLLRLYFPPFSLHLDDACFINVSTDNLRFRIPIIETNTVIDGIAQVFTLYLASASMTYAEHMLFSCVFDPTDDWASTRLRVSLSENAISNFTLKKTIARKSENVSSLCKQNVWNVLRFPAIAKLLRWNYIFTRIVHSTGGYYQSVT